MRGVASIVVLAGLVLGMAPVAMAADAVEGAASVRAAVKEKRRIRVIARLKEAPPAAAARAMPTPETGLRSRMAGMGVATLERLGELSLVAMEVDQQQLEALLASGTVAKVQRDRLLRGDLEESVPLVGAPAAVRQGASGAGQVVAILDSGVDASHPFLKGKVLSEACFSSTVKTEAVTSLCRRGRPSQLGRGAAAPCPATLEGCGHGTHVAGIAAGKGSRFSGVAPEAKIIAIQIFSRVDDDLLCGSSASCTLAYESDIIRGLNHVRSLTGTYRIAAVNLSLGGGGTFVESCDGELIKEAIDALRTKGVATVISAGNNRARDGVSYPGCISSAITVASSTDTGTEHLSGFSNMGALVDLEAPGQAITSSVPGGGFRTLSGTSMATPHVAGAWAALKSVDPKLGVSRIEETLEATGRPLRDARSGLVRPRLDVAKALTALRSGGRPVRKKPPVS